MAPKLWFFWTRTFLALSAGSIVLATALVWLNRHEAGKSFVDALGWETAVLAWLTFLVVTTCHEFAHGLTCKRHGGEVHEVGFLLLFLMPCFYCNVSDAWLFREKSKRLWVTFAGGYFELFLWALAVFVWRLTLPGTLFHSMAFMVLSVCGVQTLFNFNPLLKLDGYYLLSDWLEIPNLQQQALAYVKGHLRWLFWGAPRPEPPLDPPLRNGGKQRGLLLGYGLVSWLFSFGFLMVMLVGLFHFLGTRWGLVGLGGAALLGFVSTRGVFQGISTGEVRKMVYMRHKRTAVWLLILGVVPAALYLIEVPDRSGGPFQVRPAVRAEVRAPLAGFLQAIHFDEGDRVSAGVLIARLEVPDLDSRMAQKRAEVREVEAKLRLLEKGPRPEEVVEQRHRIERAQDWRDLARQDLAHTRQAHQEDLARLDKLFVQQKAELDFAQEALGRAKRLLRANAISEEEYGEANKRVQVAGAQLDQARAEKRARQARGTQEAEAELTRREKELADGRATLTLLEAGSRPEEIEAEKARLARLLEEARYLEALQKKIEVRIPVAGVITTPHLKERVGQYVHDGDLICMVEECCVLEAEITVAEQEMAPVRAGQTVELKARTLPFQTFSATVDRIAPSAGHGEVQSTVTVYCRLEEATGELRPGMTGYARIYSGRRPAGEILIERVMRYVRTEFWW